LADFVDIPIDVTAKQIENKVKETIDDTVRKGSPNPVASGAVANFVELFELTDRNIPDGIITTDMIEDGAITEGKLKSFSVSNGKLKPNSVSVDKILDNAITTSKILDKNVTSKKIADQAIELNHLSDNLAIPSDKLEEKFWKLKSFTLKSFADIDAIFDDEDHYNTIYQIQVSGLFPQYDVVNGDDLIGIASNINHAILLHSRQKKATWIHNKGLDNLERIDADLTYRPESEAPQSGIAVAEAVSNLPYVKLELPYYPLMANAIDELGNYSIHVLKTTNGLPCRISLDELKLGLIGDIDTALDELHTYAQGLITGGVAE
jgi:hypothetical protein